MNYDPIKRTVTGSTIDSPAPETCEDRDYRCCETQGPPVAGEDYGEWYDRHLAEWRNGTADHFVPLPWKGHTSLRSILAWYVLDDTEVDYLAYGPHS